MNLLEKIQALCDQKDITIYKLEQETELTKGSIRKWDASSPSSDKLLRVARYFNVSMESLLDDNEIKESVPYKFIKKMISVTDKGLLKWNKFTDLEKDFNPIVNPNASGFFIYDNFRKILGEKSMIDKKSTFYAAYKSGGYLLAKIEASEKDDISYAFFIFCNDDFSLYASDNNLPVLGNLFEIVKSKVIGADDLINTFLFDDFGNESVKIIAENCIICGKKLKKGEDTICEICRLKSKDKQLVQTEDNSTDEGL
jgi:hypothetical protein